MNSLISSISSDCSRLTCLGNFTRGLSPLHVACTGGHLTVVRSLVEDHGLDVRKGDAFNRTPLFMAVAKGHLDITKFLIDAGAQANSVNTFNRASLIHTAVQSKNAEVCEYLLTLTPNVDVRDNSGNTPLHLAARLGCLDMCKLLLDKGASINNVNNFGNSPFLEATSHCKLNVMEYLNTRGADTRVRDRLGNGVLHVAVRTRSYLTTRYALVDLNLPWNVTNHGGQSVSKLATDLQLWDIIFLLLKAGAEAVITDEDVLLNPGNMNVSYMRRITSNPRSLQDLCCFRIRHILGDKAVSTVFSMRSVNSMQGLDRFLNLPSRFPVACMNNNLLCPKQL
ncbi:ankyrin repeat, PH and SEC7 domain containing protein secG-like [Haliotis asinina]|uniref:ankyrin repeat, PH and SEC7 domain containing protein secG-like n=1 Tax=Haliotis asinina TaxID=109174 RepID=UPI0035322CB9